MSIGEGKTAFLIEDDTVHRKLVKMRLQQMGFVVITAIHHREADDILAGGKQDHEIRIDLIVSDNNTYENPNTPEMKKYTGIAWIKKLRNSESINKHIPTILHTASRDPDERERQALEAGADVFLHKVLPDDPDDAFLKAIEEALGLNTKENYHV